MKSKLEIKFNVIEHKLSRLMEDSKIYSISKFAKDLLEIPDNLERAIEAADKEPALKESELYSGI